VAGCATLHLSQPTTTQPSTPVTIDGVEVPDATSSHWRTASRAILNAPPQDVFEFLKVPIHRLHEKGYDEKYTTIDHSASDAGPGDWGVGSRIQVNYHGWVDGGGLPLYRNLNFKKVVIAYQPTRLIAFRSADDGDSKNAHYVQIWELKPSTQGGTELTGYYYATPDSTPILDSLHHWAIQRNMDMAMDLCTW
jgi:hypothetical protein